MPQALEEAPEDYASVSLEGELAGLLGPEVKQPIFSWEKALLSYVERCLPTMIDQCLPAAMKIQIVNLIYVPLAISAAVAGLLLSLALVWFGSPILAIPFIALGLFSIYFTYSLKDIVKHLKAEFVHEESAEVSAD